MLAHSLTRHHILLAIHASVTYNPATGKSCQKLTKADKATFPKTNTGYFAMAQRRPEKRLDSWKEIAAYLGRDERTAIRWANQRGLPIHHVPGPGRGRVFAYAEEIDAWLLREQPAATEARAVPLWRRWAVIFPVIAVVVLVIAFVRSNSRQALSLPVAVRLQLDGVEALGRGGRVLWRYSFPQPLQEAGGRVRSLGELARVADLDGDSRPEVLVVGDFAALGAAQGTSESVLYCFSSDGRLLWQWKAEMTLRFAGREFAGPWYFHDLVTSPPGGRGALWLAVGHYLWWPSAVVRIDAGGRAEMVFVNSGQIYALNYAKTGEGNFLLAGGFNNEYELAALAVLQPDASSGSSPQGYDSSYRALEPPSGHPREYFLFPRSEINLVEHKEMNSVQSIRIAAEEITVVVDEGFAGNVALYQFHLAPQFRLAYADYSDGYWRLHRTLEKEGRLHHTVEECHRLNLPLPVRQWSNGSWQTLRVPSQYIASHPKEIS